MERWERERPLQSKMYVKPVRGTRNVKVVLKVVRNMKKPFNWSSSSSSRACKEIFHFQQQYINIVLWSEVIWRSEQLRMCWLPQMWWCAPSVHRSSCVGLGRGSCAPPIHHHHQNHQNNHHHYFIYCQILSGLGVQPCHTEDHPPPLSISFWQGK